jgi:hypothetical protein
MAKQNKHIALDVDASALKNLRRACTALSELASASIIRNGETESRRRGGR